jgi:hypothetical protein
MKGNTMVIDHTRRINSALEESIPFVLIELEFQCFHSVYGIVPIDEIATRK